jgi:uncharacterized protein (UPF0147 family)
VKFLSVIIFLFGYISLNANIVLKKDLKIDNYYLQVASCEDYICIEKEVIPYIKDESYFIDYYNNLYVGYIVNINTRTQAIELQKRYKKRFVDSILRTNFQKTKENQQINTLEKIAQAFYDKKILIKKKPIVIQKPIIKKIISIKSKLVSDYKSALIDYKNKNYQSCYDKFNKLFQTNLKDSNINFYLGRCAYENKNYHEAIIAYERVLFEKPKSTRTKFEMAKSYFAKNSFKASKKLFVDVLKDKTIPKKIEHTSKSYLAKIDNNTKKHFLSGVAILGIVYDNNVNSSSTHDIYKDVTVGGVKLDLNNSTEKDGALAHQEIAVLNYKYLINDKIDNTHDIVLFAKSFFDNKYKSKNIKLVSYTSSLKVQHTKKLNISYSLFVDNLFIENKNNMYSYGLSPKLNYIYNDKITINNNMKYQKKYYKNSTDKIKDSVYIENSTNISYKYKHNMIFNPSVFYSFENTKKSNDNRKMGLKINTTYLIKPTIPFSVSLSYNNTKYTDTDPTYLVKEENKEFKIGVDMKYIYSKSLIIQTMAEYTNQTSNKEPNEYRKYTAGFNLIRIL